MALMSLLHNFSYFSSGGYSAVKNRHCSFNSRWDKMAKWAHKIGQEAGPIYQTGFFIGLQPISYSLRVLGIDLDAGQPRSKLRRFGFNLSMIVMLIFVFTANVIHYCLYPVKEFPKNMYQWCKLLRKSTRAASAILFQLAFVSVVLFGWKLLWKKLRDMEHFITFQVAIRGQLRNVLASSLATVLSVVQFFTKKFKSLSVIHGLVFALTTVALSHMATSI